MKSSDSRRSGLPRGRRAGVTVVVGLVLLAGCVLAAVAAVQVHAGRDATVLGHVGALAERLRTHDWRNIGVLLTGAGLALAGLLLLAAAVLPARRPLVTLADLDERTEAGITRAGLRRDLGAVVAGVDGITSARVRLRGRRVLVVARTRLRDRHGLVDAAHARVDERLAALRTRTPLRVRVRVVRKPS